MSGPKSLGLTPYIFPSHEPALFPLGSPLCAGSLLSDSALNWSLASSCGSVAHAAMRACCSLSSRCLAHTSLSVLWFQRPAAEHTAEQEESHSQPGSHPSRARSATLGQGREGNKGPLSLVMAPSLWPVPPDSESQRKLWQGQGGRFYASGRPCLNI